MPSLSSPFEQSGAAFSVVTNTSSEDVGNDLDRTHELKVMNKKCDTKKKTHSASYYIFAPAFPLCISDIYRKTEAAGLRAFAR